MICNLNIPAYPEVYDAKFYEKTVLSVKYRIVYLHIYIL